MPRPRLAHLSSVHSPFDVRIFYKQCRTLAAEGYDVLLIAPHDRDELRDRVHICSVPLPGNRKQRMTRTAWYIYRAAIRECAQICHFHDPELIPVGLLLRLRKRRVIYDVHEDVAKQNAVRYWIPPRLQRMVGWCARLFEWIGGRAFDAIVPATPAIADKFPAAKTFLVQNFPILKEFDLPRIPAYAERQCSIAYIGGISRIRGARQMVEATGLLSKSFDAKLVLAGNFDPPELVYELQKIPGWERVFASGWQPRKAIAQLLASARVGLVLFHPSPNHINAYPNKLFEYLSAGLPIVASDFPLWRRIVEEAGCGLLVDPLEPYAIADAVQWLLENPEEAENMGRRGREAVRARYNWDKEAKKLVALYERLLK